MKKLLALLTCSTMTGIMSYAAETYVADNVDLSDGHEETFNVASGDTEVHRGIFSGSGSVKKTGDGTLAFEPLVEGEGGAFQDGANTFTGGITVQGGTVRADNAGAFGSNAITISSSGGAVRYGSEYQSGVTTYTEFTNDIDVTVGNTARTVTFSQNTILRGDITGAGQVTLYHDNGSSLTTAGQEGPSAKIYGTVETSGTLLFRSLGTFEMHGPVKAATVYGGDSNSGTGTTELYNAANEIDTYIISHDTLSLMVANAIPGALIEWRPCTGSTLLGRSRVLLNGNNQTFSGLQFCPTGSWAIGQQWGNVRYDAGNRVAFYSSAPATITLTGIANTTCPSYMKLRDEISLVVNAADAPGFVQEFHYHPNPTMGNITVQAGTLSITNGASFQSVQTVTVGADGTLLVTASTNTFMAAKNLVVNGCLSCADNVVTPFSSLDYLEIGSTATVTLPTGCTINTRAYKLGGDLQPDGSYPVGGGTVVVSNDLVLDGEYPIIVSAGTTNVLSRRVTGTGWIHKTGGGALMISNAENDFSGGLTIDEGTVLVAATNALGSGTITLNANGNKVCQLRFIANAEISNPIRQYGVSNSSYPSLYFEKDVTTVLKGGFTGNDHVFFWNEQKVAGGTFPAPGPTTIFDCTVNVTDDKYVNTRNYGEFHFKRAVTALGLEGFAGTAQWWSEGGKVFLYSPDNYFWRFNDYSATVVCMADNVLGGSIGRMEFRSDGNASGGVGLDLNGHDQTTKSLTTASSDRPTVRNSAGNYHCIFSSGGPATLTLTGESASRVFDGGINGPVSLTVNAPSGWWQSFSAKVSKMTGDLSVISGNVELYRDGGFPNASSVTIGRYGRIYVGDNMAIDAFKNVPQATIAGRLDVKSGATMPFADGMTDLELSDTAALYIEGDMTLSFKTVTTNGVTIPGGTRLTSSTTPMIKSGAILVLSENPTAWTGAGAGDSVWTGGNWEDPSVVSRLDQGSVMALFATGGRAENNSALALGGIQFAGNDFTIAGTAPGATLSIDVGGVRVAESETPHTYTLADMAITQAGAGTHNWTIPSNQTLRVKNGLVSVPGTIKMVGAGDLVLEGTNTFAGGFSTTYDLYRYAPMLTVSGLLATPDHVDQGRPTENDGKSIFLTCEQDSGSANRLFCLSNAVVEKPVLIRYANSGRTSIFAPANTANELRGQVRYLNNTWHKVIAEANAEIVFSGGLEAAHSFRHFGDGILRFKDNPCSFNKMGGLNPSRGTAIVEVPGNTFLRLVVGYEDHHYPTVQLAVSDAMTDGELIIGYNGGYYDELHNSKAHFTSGRYTLDLMEATTQRCSRVALGPLGVLKGTYPSMLEVAGDNPRSTDHERRFCIAGVVTNGVGFHMCGSGTLLLSSSGTYNTVGDLKVSSGTLELESGVVWNKGTNATVVGSGTLKVNATGALGSRQVVLFVGDPSEDWKLDIPAGCKLMVRELCDAETGRRYSSGEYGNAASGAPLQGLADHFVGNGTLLVARPYTTICFR